MHKVYDTVAAAVSVPILHIAECVGERMKADGVATAALFGTSNVMTESFYRRRLVAHGIDLLPPDMDNVETLDRIIYDELIVGKVTRDAERALKTMITVKEQEGAEAIVLACTELELVVDVDANVLPIYDSTRIHAEKAAEWILGEAELPSCWRGAIAARRGSAIPRCRGSVPLAEDLRLRPLRSSRNRRQRWRARALRFAIRPARAGASSSRTGSGRAGRAASSSATATGSSTRSPSAASPARPRCSSRPTATITASA